VRILDGMQTNSRHRGPRACSFGGLRSLAWLRLTLPRWWLLRRLLPCRFRLRLNCLTQRCRSLRPSRPGGMREHKAAEQPRAQPWSAPCCAKMNWESHALLS
jgi:hypothetical protein